MNDKEIIYAEQELFHFTAQYNVYIRGEYSYKIRKLFKFFKLDFELDNGYFVEGDFLSLDFKVFDFKHNEVARISRKFFSIGDKYEIIINDKSKLEILLSIIIVIINIIDERQSSSNENI